MAVPSGTSPIGMNHVEKSALMMRPKSGMMMSLIKDVTIAPNAPPMMTPTAMSTTLPFKANALKSEKNFFMFKPPY